MATSRNNRDVKLTLSVETLNEDSIDKLRQSVLQLAKEGGDAAPEFQQLADQIDRIADQTKALETFRELAADTERLAHEQLQAKTALEQFTTELRDAQAVTSATAAEHRRAAQAVVDADTANRKAAAGIQTLKAQYKAGQVTLEEYNTGMVRLRQEQERQAEQLPQLRKARDDWAKTTREAETAEARLEAQYVKSLGTLQQVEQAQRQNGTAVEAAASSARDLGVATDSVQASSIQLLTSLNQLGQRAEETAAGIREMAEADRLLAIEERTLAELHQRAAVALQAEEQAQREAAHAADEYAEALRQAAAAQRQWQAEADAIVEAAENAAKLRRESELLIETQRQLANQRAFEQTAADAAKLRQAAEYVQFWERSLAAADAEAAKTAAGVQRVAAAFDKIGVKSVQDLQREIAEVRVAMATLANTAGVTGDQLTGAFAASERRVSALQREIREVTGTLTTADKAAKLFANSMGQITAGNLVADGIGYLVEKVKEMGREFVTAIVGLDQMRRGLNAVYKDALVTAQQILFLRETASTAGVSFGGLSKEFVKFSAAMHSAEVPIATSNALFKELVAASAALGQSSDDTAGSLNALGQMASKGVVSMEELRQQLGDRLPGAFGLVANGLGITQAELVKLVESGGLAARDLFPALTSALRTMRGETDGLVPTWERLKGALTETAQAAGDAGWTEIMTAGLKTLGVVAATLLLPLQGLFEIIGLLARSAGILAGSLVTLTNPTEALAKLFSDAAERQSRLTDSFDRMIGLGPQAVDTLNQTSTATGTLAKTTQQVIDANAGMSRSSQLAAVAANLAGNSALEASSKYVQFNLAAASLIKAQEQESVALDKSAKAVKTKGDSLVDLARLQGQESAVLAAATKAADEYAAASNKLAVSKQQELALQEAALKGLEQDRAARGLSADAVKVQREALEQKVQSAKAEAQQATESAAAADREAFARRLAAQTYADNSARVEEYRAALDAAAGALQAMEALQRVGLATDAQVLAARERLTEAQVLFKDGLEDSVRAIQLEAQAKSVALAMETANYSARVQSAEIMARQARLSGDNAQATYYEIEAKRAQIEITRIRYELMKLEAEAQIEALQLERSGIVVTDAVTAAKAREIELRIQMQKVKLAEAGASDQLIRALERELSAMIANQNQRDSGRGSIDADTTSRLKNKDAINAQTAALNAQANRKTSDGLDANADGSAKGTFNNTLPVDQAYAIIEKLRNGTLTASDLGMAQAAMQQAKNAQQWLNATRQNSPGSVSTEAITSTQALYNGARNALDKVQYLAEQEKSSSTSSGTTKTVNVSINGRSTPINVASDADMNSLTSVMRQLESASNTTY